MTNRSKAKGTAGETRVVNYLKTYGYEAIRVALSGANDQGDVSIISQDGSLKIVLEVKSGKQTANISRKQREDWLAETRKERNNARAALAYLVIAKHGASVKDYHVWSESGERFWYLDQWARDPVIKPARRGGLVEQDQASARRGG
jgi:Holliday junction resolvase